MAARHIKVSGKMLFTWLMLFGLILLFTPESITGRLQFAFARVFRLPLGVSRSVSLAAGTHRPLRDTVSRRLYEQLRNHAANLERLLDRQQRKIDRLSQLRDRLPLEGAKLATADVIACLTEQRHCEMLINRGTGDGLAAGQYVLGDNSVIGIVCDAASRTAKVRLLTDSASKVAVTIPRLGISAVMKGTGGDTARIGLVSTEKAVRKDDLVFAGKKPGFLDCPIVLGSVFECRPDDDKPLTWDITVKPACDVGELADVVVIIMNPQDGN
jgi:rod shape-determining protein MreC